MVNYVKSAQGSWIWLVVRLYIGYQWLQAGWHWWASFLEKAVLPRVSPVQFLVQSGELIVGLALVLGFATLFAAVLSMVLNVSFILSGTGQISPVFMALQIALVLFGGAYAGYLGVDFWFRPWFQRQLRVRKLPPPLL